MKKRIAFIIIILLFVNITPAASYSPGDIEWDTAATGTLSKGGTLTNGNYTVKAVQFASAVPGVKDINGNIIPETPVDPSVLIEIYKNNVLIKDLVMTTISEPYIDPDYEVKVSTTGFNARNAREWVYEYYNPSASVSIQLRAKPKIEVTVTTDKTTYTSYENQVLTATVTVKNTGKAFAKNVDVKLDTAGLEIRGGGTSQLKQYYYKMDIGTTQSYEVILVVPQLINEKSYPLRADAKGIDAKDLEYKSATGIATLTVSPRQNFFTLSKAVSKDRIYLSNNIVVRITVATSGMFDVYNVHINDRMSDDFKLESNTPFNWTIPLLKPGEEWGTTYSIKSIETNIDGFTLPSASASFTANNKQYSASSASPKVIVNGPKIILNKTVDKSVVNINDDVNVTIIINNKGNIATKAEVKDTYPEGVSLVSGSTSFEGLYLELNTPQTFSYTIRMNTDGNIILPAAVANYTNVEYKGEIWAVLSSERPNITVIDPSKTPAPTPAPGVPDNETDIPIQTAQPEITPTQNESFTEKLKNKIKGWFSQEDGNASSNETVEPTPTPITPGFNFLYGIMVLVFYAVLRRR
jgi:uncharacterized repeat protein (TIGR01451 family)